MWVRSFRSGKKWFLKLEKEYGKKLGTQKNYAIGLQRFCEFTEKNPDEIITAYKEALAKNMEAGVSEWNDQIDFFVPWVIEKYGVGRVRAKDHFAAVKSFFDYNSAIGLSAKVPEAFSEEKLPVTIDDIRDKILQHADIQERFIVLFLKDCGVSQAEALRFDVGDVKDESNGYGYMRVFRKKEGVNYETFIGPNATTAMQQYLEYRKRSGEVITNESPLFTKKNKLGERLTRGLISYQLQALGKKAGVDLSSHRLRKTFETFLAIGKVHPIILKYWMGHKIKSGRDVEARYIIPPKPEQMKLYKEAYRHIDVTPKPDERKLLLAEVRTRMGAFPPDQRQNFLNEITAAYRSRAQVIRDDPKIRELLREYSDCPNGEHCPIFKEIGEDELLTHLNESWSIAYNLKNGKIIVQRD